MATIVGIDDNITSLDDDECGDRRRPQVKIMPRVVNSSVHDYALPENAGLMNKLPDEGITSIYISDARLP